MATDAYRLHVEPDVFEPFCISQGFRVGDMVYTSGQAALNEAGDVVGVDDFDAQAEQTFANLRRVLNAGGADLSTVVKVTIYLTDMRHFPAVVELRRRHFAPPWPADTIVEVASLALPELLIEIEAVALANGRILPGPPSA